MDERIITIMNGFDEEPLPRSTPTNRFVLAYAGSTYAGRDPRALFRACANVIRSMSLRPEDFGIDFLGDVTYGGAPLTNLAREAGIDAYVTSSPPRPRAAALEFLANATMLVVLPQVTPFAIPAKVFEYMQFDAWILALTEPDSAVAQLLRGTDAVVIAPTDERAMTHAIAACYRQFVQSGRPRALRYSYPQFSRQHQAQRLFDAIDSLGTEHGRASAHTSLREWHRRAASVLGHATGQ